MSKWHLREIPKGVYGDLSKIKEELEEAYDAEERGQILMLMFELSDIIGAAGGVAAKYGMNLDDLVTFSKLRSEIAIADQHDEPTAEALKEMPEVNFDRAMIQRNKYALRNQKWTTKWKKVFISWMRSLAFWRKEY